MLRVARLTYKCHYNDLTAEQLEGLVDLAADMAAEADELKKRQKSDQRTAEAEAEARRS